MKKRFPGWLIWIAVFACCYVFGAYLNNSKPSVVYIWSDAEGYYMYLPAIMMYGGDFSKIPVRTSDHFKPYPGTDKIFTKYTYGVALLEAPFFAGAYVSRIIQGFDPNVYNAEDYSVALLLAACFYGVLGLFLLYKSLRLHIPGKTAARLTIAVLLLGTNLLHYMVQAPGMSHAYSFFLFAGFILLTPGLINNPSAGRFLLGGLLAGLITVIRPTNILILIYPLLYGVTDRASLKERVLFLWNNGLWVLAAATAALMVWLPQFYYWHYLSGHWIIDSYPNEHFRFWNDPQIGNVLFSVLNGFFTYNPVLLVPVVATAFLLKRNYLNSWAIAIIFILATYIFSSWWCWWFGGALGARSYVELLTLLAFPLCFTFTKILSAKRLWIKYLCLSIMGVLVFYGFRCVMLYNWTWSHFDWNKEKYWREVFEQVFFF